MNFKKTMISALSVATLVSVAACSSPVTNSPAVSNTNATTTANLTPGTFNAATNSIFVGDAGHGKKGANLNFSINLPQSSFTTKANGVIQGRAEDINSIRIFLTKSDSDPEGTGNVVFDSNRFAVSGGAGSFTGTRTYTISNLSTQGTFYVGVQLFNSSDNLNKKVAYTTAGNLPLALSSAVNVTLGTGGTGVINVSPASVSIGVNLRDGIGGSVDAAVTPTTGASIAPVSIQESAGPV